MYFRSCLKKLNQVHEYTYMQCLLEGCADFIQLLIHGWHLLQGSIYWNKYAIHIFLLLMILPTNNAYTRRELDKSDQYIKFHLLV